MRVDTLEATSRPEEVVCRAARGDYFDGYVGDTPFVELMKSVEYDDGHVDVVDDIMDDGIATETDYRKYALLERLFRRGHYGPYEHIHASFTIEGVSRACMAQLTRHRHASFDVQSQRYVDFSKKDDPVKTPKSLRESDYFTRETGAVEVSEEKQTELREEFESIADDLVDSYETMVEAGIPKEDARFILPIGTKVNMTVSMNARALLHVANLRERANAQGEIRELTNKVIDEEFADWMPMTHRLWREHGPTEIAP